MSTRFLVFDYETRSAADLKKVGSAEYAMHPSTRILCAAWRLGTKEELRQVATRVWSPAFESSDGELGELIRALLDPLVKIVAHNAFFEQVITRFVFSKIMASKPGLKTIPSSRWICTAARAAALALPRKLEGACEALKLPIQKDMEGNKLMMKYAKPRKPTKNNPAKWHKSKADLRRIMQYCATDVDAEVELFLTTPSLNATEKLVWLLDQEINLNGLNTDGELVDAVLKMVIEETENLNAMTHEMTGGLLDSTTQRDRLLKYIRSRGGMLPNLQAKTVADALGARLLDDHCSTLLRARQAVSKTSTAKYEVFKRRAKTDGRVRDLLMYWGASTGRWSGKGIQPQNFPRGQIKIDETLVELIKGRDLEFLRLVYGDPMEAFASALRGVIVPTPGTEFFCGDYATIEVRVLFWLAGNENGLQAFREGRGLYEEMAAVIYNIDHVENVTPEQRQVGKAVVLGAGFQMGWKTFIEDTFKKTGIRLTPEMSKLIINAYRNKHKRVPKMWSNLEKAAIAAVRNPGKVYTINKTRWFCKDGFLWCELPSGRCLAYYGPTIRTKETPWKEKRPALYHWSVHPKTRKWVNDGTYGGRLAENVVQAVARDAMAEAMLRLKKHGYTPVLSVHDELLSEAPLGKGSVKEFELIMAKNPSWADGLPIKVEAWSGPRYRK